MKTQHEADGMEKRKARSIFVLQSEYFTDPLKATQSKPCSTLEDSIPHRARNTARISSGLCREFIYPMELGAPSRLQTEFQ